MDNSSFEISNYTDLSAAKRTGNKIRKIREAKGLSQSELGKMVGLNGDRIQKYENGVRRPKADLLEQIASALSVNILSLSDLNAEDSLGAMYMLFLMEDSYGIDFHSSESGPAISFRDDDMGEYMRQWMERNKAFNDDLQYCRTENERKSVTFDYSFWKWNFPEKKDKNEIKKTLEHQINLLQERINEL
ncbi:MAG: helix-turn-helix domain-containing protein, partial [Lachnospiraceae bacterium]|nr:helix-turn-helix domain-containing protein [Lachnospiraceae bacterium]